MSDASRGGGKIDLGSPSSHVSHVDEDRGLLKRMDVLEENMKLIMTALNIGGVKNRITRNKDVGVAGESTYTENLVKDRIDVEPHIDWTQPILKEDEVIVDVRIVVRVAGNDLRSTRN